MSEHAISNAKGWLAEIVEKTQALDAAQNAWQDEGQDEAEALREEIEQMPLSVMIRNGWYSPGDESKGEPDEFEILLSTGGPALRIFGDIGHHGQVANARLQWQDWGTPWTDHDTTAEEDSAIEAFAGCFYLGEG